MVQISSLTKRYSDKILFENVTIKLDMGKRYGLIGANGSGKSTFLKILSKIEDATSGEISIQKDLKVGTLGQNQYDFEQFTIFDAVLYGNKKLYNVVKEKEKLYESVEFTDEINNRLSELEIMYVEEDPTYEYDVKISKVLQELGFDKDVHQNNMSSIDNADKFKILLAQVLFPKPDILFLDEPTNNLDINTINWLENELKQHSGVLVVISHDRHFLNGVVTHILDVDFKQIREFTGNYDDWYMASSVLAKQNELGRDKKLKEKKELEDFIARFGANASKAKQATSRQKRLDKLDVQKIEISSRREPSIVFKQQRAIGNEALLIKNISKSFDSLDVINSLSLTISPNEKIAIIGTNGVGKSTFCELITQNLAPDNGDIVWGQTVYSSYFPQNTTDIINGDDTLYDWLQSFKPKEPMDSIRNALGRMLFNGDEQKKTIKRCSGGEKHRMMLSKIMLEEPNFIILDEPSNHLDLEAIIALGEALYKFEGNVICVAHDRELLNSFANRVIEFHADGTITDFNGGYEDYMNSKK
jgi:ATPase subunit of ABC transporter with duplicated ATPase domains